MQSCSSNLKDLISEEIILYNPMNCHLSVCSAAEILKKGHFVGSPHRRGKLNTDYCTLMSVLLILTTAVSRTAPHDSGHNYSSCGLISSDSCSLNEKVHKYKCVRFSAT